MREAEPRIDPRTLEALANVVAPSEQSDVSEVCQAADAASPWLAGLAPPERAVLLRQIAAEIEVDRFQLVAAADRETALGVARLEGELSRSIRQFQFLADVVEEGSWLAATIDSPQDGDQSPGTPDLRRMMMALGVVAVFAASNFPFAFSVLGGDVASALAAGCPVVVKMHPGHPETSRLSVEVIKRALVAAGGKASAIGVLSGREAGVDLVKDARIRAVGFTGSTAGGLQLAAIAAGRSEPIPFYGELGSVNPIVVTPQAAQARPEELATGIVDSFTLGVGQFCTKPGIALIPEGPAGDRLLRSVAGQSADVAPGYLLTPSIHAAYHQGATALGRIAGVQILTDVPAGSGGLSAGALVSTAPAATVLNGDTTPLAEHFGPAIVLLRYRDMDEVITVLDAVGGSLTCSVHAELPSEIQLAQDLVSAATARAGRVVFNGFPTGVAVSWAMQHGGPFPASTSAAHTSVGAAAMNRFLRPVSFQNLPAELLPPPVQDHNPWQIPQRVDGGLQ